MGMPHNVYQIRHGYSEANHAQKLQRNGNADQIPEAFWNRHDWEHRLMPEGVEQARVAGKFLGQLVGKPIDEYFDRMYLSPFIRTRETAVNLGATACGTWLLENRVIERNWGTYGAVPNLERAELYAHTSRMRKQSSLYTQLDNGESIAYNTAYRVRDWCDTLHRDMDGKNVLAVVHGEFMWATRFVLENMLPEEWNDLDANKTERIKNCTIQHYTRQNPETGEIYPALKWRRIFYPDAPDQSPYGGDWQELPGKRYMTAADLAKSITAVPRLFP